MPLAKNILGTSEHSFPVKNICGIIEHMPLAKNIFRNEWTQISI